MSAIPVQVLSAIYQEDLLEMAAIALIAYEYIITFDQEVALFWRRKATGATALFFGTRYIGLLTYSFLGAATYAPMSDKMNYFLAFAVFIFALGPFVINLHTISLGLVGTNIQPFGCGGGADLTQALAIILTTVLTCRFLLALQSANQQALGQGSADAGEDDQRGGGSTLQFASRIIGSIAASISLDTA
ncbi:hypothetical protein TRAPUB_9796 [Trametes pubescens]|uniref:DUF6533 domain-containing protein n=1 Tax=Trametes pubescens TaxID=154538 RepID=A0A1M2W1G7_TRAPU|nr:hypothetical protein TRAPUB_9796 [Trametes pubescens]